MEPLHVTFAREVLGCSVSTDDNGPRIWYCDCEGLPYGPHTGELRADAYIHSYDLDRAYCQELAEINHWSRTYSPEHDLWYALEDCECIEMGAPDECSSVLLLAIEAKRAGVDVKVPGGAT